MPLFNSTSALLKFFMSGPSNFTLVLLNTYKHSYIERLYTLSIFMSMSRSGYIYVVSM